MKKFIFVLALSLLCGGAQAQEKKAEPQKETPKPAAESNEKSKSADESKFNLTDFQVFETGLERGNYDLVNAWVKRRCKYNEEVYGTTCDEMLEQAQSRDCIAGNKENCFTLGKKYQNQEYGYIWLKFSCLRRDHAESCYEAFLSVTARKGSDEEEKATMPILEKGCKLGHKPSCDAGGYVFNKFKNYKVAAELWEKVCHPIENWKACAGVAEINFREAYLWEALKFYEMACLPGNYERQQFCKKGEIIFESLSNELAKKVKLK